MKLRGERLAANQLPKTEPSTVPRIKKFTHCHHLGVSDSDAIDFLRFDGKLRYKNNSDPYGSLAAKKLKTTGHRSIM
jgi:hypothetical protein